MNNKPVAIVLGGIVPHGEVLKKLKNRGYYTVLIDYFDNPPAAQYADFHSKESAMDYEAVLKVAKEYQAALVVSPCLDQQLVIAMKVSETLDLPHPFSSEIALTVTNKKNMKQMMMENGIPTARFYQVDANTDLSELILEYPIIVKPTDACGSAGVQRVYSFEALTEAVKKACGFSWSGEAIVEEFKQGIEVSAYTYIKNGKAIVVTTSQRLSVFGEDNVKCFSVVNPAFINEKVQSEIQRISDLIAKTFGLVNTPMFFQSIVKDDKVNIIEFSPRLGGGVGFRVTKLSADFDMLDASIASYLGEEYVEKPNPANKCLIMQQLFAKDGIFEAIDGFEPEDGVEIQLMKTKGMVIHSEKVSSSKIGALIIAEKDYGTCFEKLMRIWDTLEVRGEQGESLLHKDLVLTRKILEDNIHEASSL